MGEDAISPLDPRFALIDALDSLDMFRAIAAEPRTRFNDEIAVGYLHNAVDDLVWFLQYQTFVGGA